MKQTHRLEHCILSQMSMGKVNVKCNNKDFISIDKIYSKLKPMIVKQKNKLSREKEICRMEIKCSSMYENES